MAELPDPEKIQASREFVSLQRTLGVTTPRKLASINALSKRIRSMPSAKAKPKGK